MARRSDHTREQIFDMAMAAAERIVETEGYRALTARSVAHAIGYSPGTLYNLFANLDEIVLHLNGRTLDRLYDRLVVAPYVGRPEADLLRLLDDYLAFLEDHPHLWQVLFDYKWPKDRPRPLWYDQKVARVLGLIERSLTPLFPRQDEHRLADVARILWAALHGICSLADMGRLDVVSARPARDMAGDLVRLLLAGLVAEPAAVPR